MASLCWLGLMLVTASAARIPLSVSAEVSARGHAQVLIELAKDGENDVVNAFHSELKGACRVLQSWIPVRVLHVDAAAGCLERIRLSRLASSVELPGTGFLAAADSLAIPRYQSAVILGAGLPEHKSELREVFRQEACFCTAEAGGCCPGGVRQLIEESAAATGAAYRTTEELAFRLARPGHDNILDGTNISLLSVRIAGAQNETISFVSVLDALDWLHRTNQAPGMLILSFESNEVFCGPCQDRTISNRVMAAYIQLLRLRGIRVLAPDLGFQIRGAPACLPGVELFPASVDLPPLKAELQPLGRIAGAVASINTFTSESAPPAGWAAGQGVPAKVTELRFERPIFLNRASPHEIPSVFSFQNFRTEFLLQNLRGKIYYLGLGPKFTYVLQHGQVSSCSLNELISDKASPR